jgi:hypothetical protein
MSSQEVFHVNGFVVSEPPAPRFNTRRKSVFAEAYDPEADDDDTSKVRGKHSDSDSNCFIHFVHQGIH